MNDMDQSLRKFAIQLILLTIFCIIAGLLTFKSFLEEYYFTGYIVMPVLFLGITLGVHTYLIKASQDKPRKFTSKFIGATGLKMFIYIIFIAIYILIDRQHAIPFLISFLILYILYTVFEVISVLNYLKNRR